MSSKRTDTAPLIEHVLHPTDFSEGSRTAFHHALKAALLAKSKLALLHVSPDMSSDWSDFPGVRETLERWGLLAKNSPRSAVPALGIDVNKVVVKHSDPVQAVMLYLEKHPADLIVLATHQHEGSMRWLQRSVSEPIARQAEQMTLFIPGDCAGFVSEDDGSVSLASILVPIAHTPDAQPALEAAALLVRRLGCIEGTFTLLHVGDADDVPEVEHPEVTGWTWRQVTQTGDVIDAILNTAAQSSADLIVMTTDGRNGFLDGLRGSHSERVLRRASAPLLTVPVGSFADDYLA